MKTLTSLTLGTVAASLITLNVASATTSFHEEIFSSLDGEHVADTSRVNFSLSAGGSTGPSLDSVLEGIDAEYGHTGIMSKTISNGSVAELPKIHD